MKSHFKKALLCILVLTSCTPSAAEVAKPSPTTPAATETVPPVPDTPAPTATPDLTFDISEDYQIIQQGNDAPAFIIKNLPSPELADNHTGLWFAMYDDYHNSEFVFTNGFTRLRLGSLYDRTDDQDWLAPDTLLPRVDEKITEYAENGIVITLTTHMISRVPAVIQEFTQEDIDTLLEATAWVVEYFKGRIAIYEIYNEFGNGAKVHTYASLVEQSAALIKEIDPDAKVIFGSIPGDFVPGYEGYGEYYRYWMNTDYMNDLIDSVDFSQIDGFSLHPFYDNIPVDDRVQNYPQMVADMKARLAARGFSGEYFADELLWHTWDEPGYPHGPSVSKTIAAKYYLRSITEHRGLDFNVTINPGFLWPELDAVRNLNNVLAGAEPADGIDFELELSQDVEYLRQYAFTLLNGDILLAVWRHGYAEEQDPGVGGTITIPDISASSVIGINVFDGFEQELVTESVDGALVIQNLLIKDYPVFVKITRDSP